MTHLKIKEFAQECGKLPSYINTYIKRGKIEAEHIFVDGKQIRVIDITLPVNSAFLNKCRNSPSYTEGHLETKNQPKQKSDTQQKQTTKKTKELTKEQAEQTRIVNEKLKADLMQKHLSIEKSKREIEKLEIANMKALGNIIPVSTVVEFLPSIVRSISQSLEKESENLIGDIIAMTGGSNTERVEYIKRLKRSIARANRSALKEINVVIDNITEDYSNKRGRGEYDRSERN